MKTKAFLHVCLLVFLLSSSFAFPTVASGVARNPAQAAPESVTLYVMPTAEGDCLAWATACDLQTALEAAQGGDQIWVASGVYIPTHTITFDPRSATFQLVVGVAVYGGFPEAGGSWEQRDWQANPTILSGDLNQNGEIDEDAYHVVTSSGVTETAVLDGFTITMGRASGLGESKDKGGGILNINGDPTLSNLHIADNRAFDGGGMYSEGAGDHLTLTNVTFSHNSARDSGGGMINNNGNLALNDVTFDNNWVDCAAGGECSGGGLYNSAGSPTLTGVTFDNNRIDCPASSFTENCAGGGMYNTQGNPRLANVTFHANSVHCSKAYLQQGECNGGGLETKSGNVTLTNVTFSNNTANSNGGGMYNLGYARLTNVIFYANKISCPVQEGDCSGGGLYTANTDMNSVVFYSNQISCSLFEYCFGGGMHVDRGRANITNATFYANKIGCSDVFCRSSGGALSVYIISHNVNLTNSIVWGNDSMALIGKQIDCLSGSVDTTYSDIQGGLSGTGNKNVNPRFLDPANGNLRLQGNSPLIDAGNSFVVAEGFDPDGNPRLVDFPATPNTGLSHSGYPFVDMGAYEFQAGKIVYVDRDAPSGGNGASWATAFKTLATGLAASASGDEIWVTEGEYMPSQRTDPEDPRSATFQLVKGVGVYGGFDGAESFRDQRDPAAHLTTLSGDLNGDRIINDDAYHVVATGGVTQTAILDGFTITMGRAGTLEGYREHGAGILNVNGSPTLANLHITFNRAFGGGGMYSEGASSRPTLSNVTFSHNYARDYGGGLYTYASSPWLTNVTFTANTSNLYGGGLIARSSSSPELLNVTIFGNNAASQGGGIFAGGGSSAILTNAIVWGNTTTSGSDPQVTGVISATFSDIQDEYTGVVDAEGNFSLDPQLEDLGDHGGFTPTHALGEGSPAVDAGSPAVCPDTDQRGTPRPMDGDQDRVAICDMGAYEVPFYWLFLPLTIKTGG